MLSLNRFCVGIGFFVASTSASLAALPAAISTEISNLETDGLALVDLLWPFLIGFITPLLLMKLFKRFGSKV